MKSPALGETGSEDSCEALVVVQVGDGGASLEEEEVSSGWNLDIFKRRSQQEGLLITWECEGKRSMATPQLGQWGSYLRWREDWGAAGRLLTLGC